MNDKRSIDTSTNFIKDIVILHYIIIIIDNKVTQGTIYVKMIH